MQKAKRRCEVQEHGRSVARLGIAPYRIFARGFNLRCIRRGWSGKGTGGGKTKRVTQHLHPLLLFTQRVLDGLLHRHSAPFYPGRREYFFAQSLPQ